MKKHSELLFSLLLVPVDFLMMIVGFAAAYLVRARLDNKPLAYHVGGLRYLEILAILLPLWIVIFGLQGLYNLSSTRRRLTEVIKVLVATASGVMILIIIDYFSRTPIFPSKSIPIYGFIFSFGLIIFGRFVSRALQRYLFRFDIGVHSVLILGETTQASELIEALSARNSGYNVVNNTTKRPAKWTLAQIQSIHETHHIDEIIQTDQSIADDQLTQIIAYAEQHHITYKYVPNLAGIYRSNVTTVMLDNLPLVEMIQTPLEGWGRIIKRIFDLFISSIVLIILSPLILVIAVLVKLTDPGPVFYRHTRIGKGEKQIVVTKFRSMYVKYSDGGKYSGRSVEAILADLGDAQMLDEFHRDFKIKNDPRVTPLGKFLRRTSLDELPQLFNVLGGDLSLVGPRPVIKAELAKYGRQAAQLLAIKPGLTGLWQVSGRNDISYEERVKLELYYVEHWSLLLDIVILARTGLMILRGTNGY